MELTRKELAALIGVSARTISRWEISIGFEPLRQYARVLRYPLATLVGLLAMGAELDREVAENIKLRPDELVALAGVIRPTPIETVSERRPEQTVLIATSEDDRLMLGAWGDPNLGPTLRKVLRGLLELSPAA